MHELFCNGWRSRMIIASFLISCFIVFKRGLLGCNRCGSFLCRNRLDCILRIVVVFYSHAIIILVRVIVVITIIWWRLFFIVRQLQCCGNCIRIIIIIIAVYVVRRWSSYVLHTLCRPHVDLEMRLRNENGIGGFRVASATSADDDRLQHTTSVQMCLSHQGILLSNNVESKLKVTILIAFDSVECVIFVFCNWYLRKPDDRPVYRTYFSELFVFVICCHASNALSSLSYMMTKWGCHLIA